VLNEKKDRFSCLSLCLKNPQQSEELVFSYLISGEFSQLFTPGITEKHGLHLHCFKDWFRLADESEDFENLTLVKENSSYSDQNKSFFHGKFEKYSASLGGRDYILKMSREYPELSKVEYVCNRLGILVGLSIPNHYLLRFQEQEDCFVSDNFMKDFKDSNLEHIWHFLKKRDKFSVETLLKVIEKKTEKLSEIQKFIKLCLFDALIGNHDRHGRNLGLIHTPLGYLFSPCYDNPSYFGIASFLGASHAPRGAIATSATERAHDERLY